MSGPVSSRGRGRESMTTVDLLAIGETLVQLAPAPGAELAMGSLVQLAPGGAESNVAMNCAQLGHRTVWAGRVGTDKLSQALVEGIAAAGVDTSLVESDPGRPTAVYVKIPRDDGKTDVVYYRRGSAASAMSPAFLDSLRGVRPRIVHLSGITPALSGDCHAMVE